MGFHMKLTLRLAALVLAAIAVASCKDKASSTDTPATFDDINNAQNDALEKSDPYSIQAGQYVYTLTTQELHSSDQPLENLIEESSFNVLEREEFGDHFEITTLKEVIDHLASDQPHYKFKNVMGMDYATPTDPSDPSAPSKPTAGAGAKLIATAWRDRLHKMDDGTEDGDTTVDFYNLRVEHAKVPRPQKVIDASPCPDGSDCDLNVTKIFYDAVITRPGEAPEREQFENWYSTDVPFFASVLKSCIKVLVKMDDALPLIRQCDVVYDYRETDPASPAPTH